MRVEMDYLTKAKSELEESYKIKINNICADFDHRTKNTQIVY